MTLKDFALNLGPSIDRTIMDDTNKVLIEHGFNKETDVWTNSKTIRFSLLDSAKVA